MSDEGIARRRFLTGAGAAGTAAAALQLPLQQPANAQQPAKPTTGDPRAEPPQILTLAENYRRVGKGAAPTFN